MRLYTHPSTIKSSWQGLIKFCAWIAALAFTQIAWAENQQARGEYLTNILGCGGCHTEGALLGEPSGPWLAGSEIGIAYTQDNPDQSPGILFPGNLTPDKETGIGNWNEADIARFLRTGMDHYGDQANTVMPWPNYASLKDQDISDIAAYLLNAPAVKKAIPEEIPPGTSITHSFVRIGVYLFIPEETSQEAESND